MRLEAEALEPLGKVLPAPLLSFNSSAVMQPPRERLGCCRGHMAGLSLKA